MARSKEGEGGTKGRATREVVEAKLESARPVENQFILWQIALRNLQHLQETPKVPHDSLARAWCGL